MPKTLNLEECAALLKVDRTTALKLAGKGELRGAKIGRAWVFIEEDVLAYLKEQVRAQVEKRMREQEPLGVFIATPGGRRKPLPRLPELPPEFDPDVLKKK